MSDHHYFASNAFCWAKGKSREEAIEKATRACGDSMVKDNIARTRKSGNAGFYVWSCKVNAPEDESYDINFYQPEGVETEAGKHHWVTYLTKREIKYCTGTLETKCGTGVLE